MPDINELQFVRLITFEAFNVIPRSLFESIKDIDSATIDRIYANSAEIMTVPVVDQKGIVVARMPAQSVWVAVLQDVAHIIKGFIWAEFDVIEQRVFIQACAVDREYQSNNGEVLQKITDYIRSLPLPDDMKNNIQMATTQPKAFEKFGCRRSKRVLMELKTNVESKQNN